MLDPETQRIRRLTATEIQRIQGFDEEWFRAANIDEKDAIRAAGDAVPPPVAEAVFQGLQSSKEWENETHLEICAGAGGLASGADRAGFETLALIDAWASAGRILKAHWAPELVKVIDVRRFSLEDFRERLGVLSGGPPCQPWSSGGERKGELDPRDLMGRTDEFVAACRPEAFVWENVPGLLQGRFREYFDDLMRRLRNPEEGLHYGVLGAILNAADYGVPQRRRRVFIIGVRDATTVDVSRIFERVHREATHVHSWRPIDVVLEDDGEEWMNWWYSSLPRGVR